VGVGFGHAAALVGLVQATHAFHRVADELHVLAVVQRHDVAGVLSSSGVDDEAVVADHGALGNYHRAFGPSSRRSATDSALQLEKPNSSGLQMAPRPFTTLLQHIVLFNDCADLVFAYQKPDVVHRVVFNHYIL